NVVDVVFTPGSAEGAPVTLKISPRTAYVTFINQATTGKAGSKASLEYSNVKPNQDGTHIVTVTGTLALGGRSTMASYGVPEPSRFAGTVLMEALKENGVASVFASTGDKPDFKALAASYKPENLVAEHVSPPLTEEVKVTLKVSQNLHASITPFVLAALLGNKANQINPTGFDLENDFLKKGGLDLTGAYPSDATGDNAFYTPDFMVHYLLYMTKQKHFADFHHALPILGKDGTLFKIQVNSPAAGHVYAKTGTYGVYDALNKNLMITGKGLAGYMETASGEHLILALYANMVAVPLEDPEATQKIVGEALGEIASAAFDAPLHSQASIQGSRDYDVLIKNGKILDGSGNPWVSGDIALRGNRIVAIGKLDGAHAIRAIDASGLVVSPGFIDMLGQSETSLLIDNRSLSKLSQGITSEITGEGGSIAPQNALTIAAVQPSLDPYKLKVDWSTLAEYFQRLEMKGTPLNLGTHVGAAQVRGSRRPARPRAPTAEEL